MKVCLLYYQHPANYLTLKIENVLLKCSHQFELETLISLNTNFYGTVYFGILIPLHLLTNTDKIIIKFVGN